MKATIVSFIPWEVNELKPGMIPSDYKILKSDGKTPSVLVVEEAIVNIYMGDNRTFPTPLPADKLAASIVEDSVKACMEIERGVAEPGIFWVEGVISPTEALVRYKDECKEALARQAKWFMRLIKVADDTWARFHQHKMIGDLQRVAAGIMGLSSKEWAITPEPVSLLKCPACATMIESTSIVCRNCRMIIKPDEAKKLGLTFSNVGA